MFAMLKNAIKLWCAIRFVACSLNFGMLGEPIVRECFGHVPLKRFAVSKRRRFIEWLGQQQQEMEERGEQIQCTAS